VVPPPPRFESAADGIPRLPDAPAVETLPLLLSGLISLGKAAAGRQGRGLDMHEEVAAALDEHRHGDGLKPAIRLEGLELVELEGPGQPSAHNLVPGEKSFVQQPAMTPESLEPPLEGASPDT